MTDAAPGYLIDELARLTGATARSIRYWVRREVLPAPRHKGPQTRYAAGCVARIEALRLLQGQGASLRDIRRRFDNATPTEIEAWVHPAPPPAAAPAPDAPAWRAEGWQRLTLVPGLELHVRDDGGEAVRQIANEIAQRWGVRQG